MLGTGLPGPWVGPGKPNLPLGLRGNAGGGARLTASCQTRSPSLPLLPIFPVTYERNGSSSCLFCSPHLLSVSQSRFYRVSLSLSLSPSRLSDQPLRWLPAPTVPRPIHSPHCSQLLQYESDHFPSLLKNHQRHPLLLSEPSLDSLIHTRRPYWRWQWHPTPVLLPGKSHGQRNLAGYNPWGCKEWDTAAHA